MSTKHTPVWEDDDGTLMLDAVCVASFFEADDFPCVDPSNSLQVQLEIHARRADVVMMLNAHDSLVAALREIGAQSIGSDWTAEQAFEFMRASARKALAQVAP